MTLTFSVVLDSGCVRLPLCPSQRRKVTSCPKTWAYLNRGKWDFCQACSVPIVPLAALAALLGLGPDGKSHYIYISIHTILSHSLVSRIAKRRRVSPVGWIKPKKSAGQPQLHHLFLLFFSIPKSGMFHLFLWWGDRGCCKKSRVQPREQNTPPVLGNRSIPGQRKMSPA